MEDMLKTLTPGRRRMMGLLYNAPILEAHYTVGQLGKLQIVGDHHQCLVKDIHGVRENILLPLALDGSRPDRAFFTELAGLLGLGEKLDCLPYMLSGGGQQCAAIAQCHNCGTAVLQFCAFSADSKTSAPIKCGTPADDIALTAVLFTAITTIALGTAESFTLTLQMQKMSRSDGEVRYMTAT